MPHVLLSKDATRVELLVVASVLNHNCQSIQDKGAYKWVFVFVPHVSVLYSVADGSRGSKENKSEVNMMCLDWSHSAVCICLKIPIVHPRRTVSPSLPPSPPSQRETGVFLCVIEVGWPGPADLLSPRVSCSAPGISLTAKVVITQVATAHWRY